MNKPSSPVNQLTVQSLNINPSSQVNQPTRYSVQTLDPQPSDPHSHYTDQLIPLKQHEGAILSTAGKGRLDLKTYLFLLICH